LTAENRAARPEAYAVYQPVASSYASRTMMMSGIIVFVFVVYHILHYTAQIQYLNLTGQNFVTFMDPEKRHDIFKMMVVGFNNGWVSAFYILGMALLCLHLSHGTSSMFQSIGWKNETYRPFLDKASRGLALLIFLGYTSIPVAILLGYGKEALR
jgi:succinate dehydrogenase / fumarate reductase cytochrome b subunit